MNKRLLLIIGLIFTCLTESFGQSLSLKLTYASRSRNMNAVHKLKTGEMFVFGGNSTNDSIHFLNPSNAIIGRQFGTIYYSIYPNRLSIKSSTFKRIVMQNLVYRNIIQLQESSKYLNYQLTSTSGKQIIIIPIYNQIDISHIPSGIYLISYQDHGGQRFYQKIQ